MLNDNTFYYLPNLSYRSNPAVDKLGAFDGESTLKILSLLRQKIYRQVLEIRRLFISLQGKQLIQNKFVNFLLTL